jgi:hypothetical protein
VWRGAGQIKKQASTISCNFGTTDSNDRGSDSGAGAGSQNDKKRNSGHGGCDSGGKLMEEHGDNDDNWCMQLVNWKNEAIVDAKKASVMSGGGTDLTTDLTADHLQRVPHVEYIAF